MTQLSILVSSYDGLSDCWGPFCHGISKYWPDCPYPIYLITNTKHFEHERISVIKVGDDRGWSSNMITALESINSRYILYFQEDYWISEAVGTSKIDDYLSLMENEHLNYIRLLSFPTPDRDFPADKRLGVIATEAEYRTSLQISLWRKDILRDLLRPRESPWDFETHGTERSRKYGDTFLCVKSAGDDLYFHGIRYVCSAINRGRWSKLAKSYARTEGIQVDFDNLPSETWWQDYQRRSKLGAAVGLLTYRADLALRNPRLALRKVRRRMRRPRLQGCA